MTDYVVVCGSRSWRGEDAIESQLRDLPAGVEVIHGGARGADATAERVCERLGIPTRIFRPDWTRHGKAAGLIRNVEMLSEPGVFLVLAFWDGRSKGTAHTIAHAVRRGLPVQIIPQASRLAA